MGFGLAPSAQTTEGLMAHGWILPDSWAWAFPAPASVPRSLRLGSGPAPCFPLLLGLCGSALGLLLASFGCLASAARLWACSLLPFGCLASALGPGPAPCSHWLLGLCCSALGLLPAPFGCLASAARLWACSLLPLAAWPLRLVLGLLPAPFGCLASLAQPGG